MCASRRPLIRPTRTGLQKMCKPGILCLGSAKRIGRKLTHHLVDFFIKKCESALRKTLKSTFVSECSAALAAFQEFEDETEAFLQPFFAMLREEQLDGSSPFVTAAQVSFISQSLFFSMLREEQLEGSSSFITAAQVNFPS